MCGGGKVWTTLVTDPCHQFMNCTVNTQQADHSTQNAHSCKCNTSWTLVQIATTHTPFTFNAQQQKSCPAPASSTLPSASVDGKATMMVPPSVDIPEAHFPTCAAV